MPFIIFKLGINLLAIKDINENIDLVCHSKEDNYMMELECPVCHGTRLKESVLNVLINKKNI